MKARLALLLLLALFAVPRPAGAFLSCGSLIGGCGANPSGATSITGTAPIVVTPSPITGTGVISFSVTGTTCSSGSIATGISLVGSALTVACTPKTDKLSCPLPAAASNNAILCDIPMTEAETVPINCGSSTGTSGPR